MGEKHPIMKTLLQAIDDMDNTTPSMRRDRPYNGQPHTDAGERGKTFVEGLTMRDICDCFIRGFVLAHESYGDSEDARTNKPYYDQAVKGEDAFLCYADIFKLAGDIDAIAAMQNMMCEVEKMMGIFPNVEKIENHEEFLNSLLTPPAAAPEGGE